MNEELTLPESKRLVELEAIIQRGLDTFIEVGEALSEIRDSKLYKIEHGTFEDYCQTKWNMGKSYAFRAIAASEVAKNLSPIGDTPRSEAQVRPLTKLKEPAQQQEAWTKAVESAGGSQPSAKQVQAAVEQVKPPTRTPRYVPADGMTYAGMAIANLSKIQREDTQRHEAFEYVLKWIEQNQ